MDRVLQEFRFALRQIARKPGLAVTVILTLALGIGLNTLIFRVADAVLLSPLPFAHAGRLVLVQNAPLDFEAMDHPDKTLTDWWSADPAFEQTAAFQSGEVTVSGNGEPARVDVAEVTPSYFQLLGLKPVQGRALTAADLRSSRPVAVIGRSFWRQRMSSGAGVLGRSLQLNGRLFTVVGVVPDELTVPRSVSVWVTASSANADLYSGTKSFHQNLLALLRPGLSTSQAQQATNLLAARLRQESPLFRIQLAMGTMGLPKGWTDSFGIHLVPLHTALVGDFRRLLTLLLLATGLVLLIACANVANLMLARGTERENEMVIRSALGASRSRLLASAMAECLVLAWLGGAAGVWLEAAAAPLMMRFVPVAFSDSLRLQGNDWTHVFVFALMASFVSALVFGVGPALSASRSKLQPLLHRSGLQSSGLLQRRRLPKILVAVEVALALTLLAGTGLLLRSLAAVFAVPSGMETQHVLVAKLPLSPFLAEAQRKRLDEAILQRARHLPGVASAGLASHAPFPAGSVSMMPVLPEGAAPETRPIAAFSFAINGDYFHSLHIALLRGRTFDGHDTAGAAPVVIVSRGLAEHLWPGKNPIGRQLDAVDLSDPSRQPALKTVVGVVADTRSLGLTAPALSSVYLPFRQSDAATMWLILRSRNAPGDLAGELRHAVLAVAPNLPVTEVTSLNDRLNDSISPLRFPTILLSLFASLSLLLACLGIYGVLSYFVARQSREIGIRLAIGAKRRDVLQLILRQGAAPVLAGVLGGLAGAFVLGRFLSSLLFHVRPFDPATVATVSSVLVSVALVAIFLPAWRACRTDPADVLRQE